MALEQTQSEVGKKGSDSDKAAIRLKEQVSAKRKGASLRARTAQMGRKGPAFSGWALSGATRRAEKKWMLFERSEFHPFPARSKAE